MLHKIFTPLLLGFALSGCGQSGPLYIPSDPSSIEAPAQPTDNDDDQGEQGEQDGDSQS